MENVQDTTPAAAGLSIDLEEFLGPIAKHPAFLVAGTVGYLAYQHRGAVLGRLRKLVPGGK